MAERSGRVVAFLLALLLPLLLLGGVLGALGTPSPWSPSQNVSEKDAMLARLKPDVVSIGNSKADTDIDSRLLGRLLGSPPLSVAKLRENASPAPIWYAVLKYRVYGGGYRPRLVLVVSTLEAMLIPTPESAESMRQMRQHFAEPDEAIARKIYGQEGHPTWERIKDNRTAFHTAVMDGLKEWTVGLFFSTPGSDRRAEGKALAEGALGQVFGTGAVEDATLVPRAMPVVEVSRDAVARAAARVEDSFIPDLIALAQQNGSRIVFVRSPVAPSGQATDEVPPQSEVAAIRLINGSGAGWLDMRSVGLVETDFQDDRHLNAQGRARFTEALGNALLEMGAMGDGPLLQAAVPLVPTRVRREGTLPAVEVAAPKLVEAPCGYLLPFPRYEFLSEPSLDRLGLVMGSPFGILQDGVPLQRRNKRVELGPECHGAFIHFMKSFRLSGHKPEGTFTAYLREDLPLEPPGQPALWWVYPGTGIAMDFEEPWGADRGEFRVVIEALGLGPGDGIPTIGIAGQEAAPLTGGQGAISATLGGITSGVTAPEGPWTLQIASPANGPYLLIRRLAFGDASVANTFISPLPHLASILEEDGVYSSSGIPILPPPGPVRRGREGPSMRAPEIAFLSTSQLTHVTGRFRCSPVRVSEDGVPLSGANAALDEVRAGGGSYLHFNEEIVVSSSDGSDPMENGRSYTVDLEPTRECPDFRWIYPGDSWTVTLPPNQVRRSVRALLLAGRPIGSASADGTALHVRLQRGEKVYLDETVPWEEVAEDGQEWPLQEPLSARDGKLTLTLSSDPGSPYLLIKLLSVSDMPTRPVVIEEEP